MDDGIIIVEADKLDAPACPNDINALIYGDARLEGSGNNGDSEDDEDDEDSSLDEDPRLYKGPKFDVDSSMPTFWPLRIPFSVSLSHSIRQSSIRERVIFDTRNSHRTKCSGVGIRIRARLFDIESSHPSMRCLGSRGVKRCDGCDVIVCDNCRVRVHYRYPDEHGTLETREGMSDQECEEGMTEQWQHDYKDCNFANIPMHMRVLCALWFAKFVKVFCYYCHPRDRFDKCPHESLTERFVDDHYYCWSCIFRMDLEHFSARSWTTVPYTYQPPELQNSDEVRHVILKSLDCRCGHRPSPETIAVCEVPTACCHRQRFFYTRRK